MVSQYELDVIRTVVVSGPLYCRLLKSSAANNCLALLTYLSIEANSVDPEQTAHIGAVWSGSRLFSIEVS